MSISTSPGKVCNLTRKSLVDPYCSSTNGCSSSCNGRNLLLLLITRERQQQQRLHLAQLYSVKIFILDSGSADQQTTSNPRQFVQKLTVGPDNVIVSSQFKVIQLIRFFPSSLFTTSIEYPLQFTRKAGFPRQNPFFSPTSSK